MLHHLVALSTSSALTFDERKDLLRKRDELIYARHPSVELVISALGLRFIVDLFELCRRVAVPHPDSSFSFSLLVFAAAVSANNLDHSARFETSRELQPNATATPCAKIQSEAAAAWPEPLGPPLPFTPPANR